jgi:hypothetical protein
MTILDHIHALETYLARRGARLAHKILPASVQGRIHGNAITVRKGLNPRQELSTLVHELAHWLVHQNPRTAMDCTVFEYEAEAVEALVMARLGLEQPLGASSTFATSAADNLLPASVARVRFASTRICDALEAQPPVDLQAAPRKEIVFEYEHYGMGDFLGLPEAL